MNKILVLIATLVLAGNASYAAAPTLADELDTVWRETNAAMYGDQDADEKQQSIEALLTRAKTLSKSNPESALARAWVGWLNLNGATLQSNPQVAIAKMNDARDNLEAALAIDANCCGVGAYVSLGILNEFPIPGAKPREDPRKYYAKALEISPDGLTSNTRYAGFLMRAGELDAAQNHAKLAIAAPPLPPHRQDEDKAIRAQAQVLLDQIDERMKK
jgi:hypothetical protein